ncbi:sensor histidine kinase [Hymenobacter pini]|uniref:sensor histidine kinase n=1 Tax=Hymenobacter pini TaxID=2880879 RepID=UPI001CF46546|nr:histidine kinase [Hymenobacter pini]MCA8832860.1 histidine kinase [Hymenobacter pini]
MQFRFKRSSYLPHVLVWLGFALYEQSVFFFTDASQITILPLILNYGLNIALFYTNSNVLLPKLYGRRQYTGYAAAAVLLLALYGLLRAELYTTWLPAVGYPVTGPAYSYGRFWVLAVYRGMFFQLVSTGYWFALNAVRLEKQRRQQEEQLRATEKSLLEANIAFLKSQINPHFLFNSLNFLYAQVYPHSENAAKAILLLSETMRYALHEDNNGKVMLSQEVKHLQNYIAINQLRYNNQLQIDFVISGNVQFLMILPLVLITFVENCFKHGELADAQNPLVIRLTTVQNQLTFQTRNKKRLGPKERSTGIGLVNTRQRLEMLYKDRYTLLINDEPDYYTCTLNIEL